MKLNADLKSIERLAKQMEDENWEFRCFIKGCNLSCEAIDTIVHRLNQEVSAAIDCQSCANCCKVLHPTLEAEDIQRLAACLNMAETDFENQYLVRDKEGEGLVFNASPCPFLSENSCTVYASRPETCRSYPHLHKEDFVFRLMGVYANCAVCPIVFNVYERLKEEFHRLNVKSEYQKF